MEQLEVTLGSVHKYMYHRQEYGINDIFISGKYTAFPCELFWNSEIYIYILVKN